MNLDELRPILHAYRQQVEQAWSPETAHEGFEGKPGDPAGQCGVTSAWLQRRLLEDHGIAAWYCVGKMTCISHEEWLIGHCWLEIGEGEDRVIIDFTSSQIPCGFGIDIVVHPHAELVAYAADRRFTIEELLADPVQERLAVLTAEVGS